MRCRLRRRAAKRRDSPRKIPPKKNQVCSARYVFVRLIDALSPSQLFSAQSRGIGLDFSINSLVIKELMFFPWIIAGIGSSPARLRTREENPSGRYPELAG